MFVKIPNKFILEKDSFKINVIYHLLRYRCVDNIYYGEVNHFMYLARIVNDKNYKNKKKLVDIIVNLGGIVNGKFIEFDTNLLYDIDAMSSHVKFTIVNTNLNLDAFTLNYYLWLVYHIRMFSGVYKNSLNRISDSFGVDRKSIAKYNGILSDCGLIFIGKGSSYIVDGNLQAIHNIYCESKIRLEAEGSRYD